ncbi:hypothetical protein GQ43DRAFT_434012 [Delitschia confertaspora ATCC 74209]|uniref:Uncharacterized protein n=1 Tax=Delitschia confertaspora ATCC 74209 TaxID=1513339 RepID=A0A9P4JGF4_9PLEO|nr:hypothetical protein GQ43DRAFT_434012 [Delitschia confertaspora ATCC 74209]
MELEDDVRTALQSAFDIVTAGIQKRGENLWPAETSALVNHLITDNGRQPRGIDTRKIREVLISIQRNYRREVAPNVEVHQSNVIIFCDDSRFELIEGGKKLYVEKITGSTFEYGEILCRGTLLDKAALAVTWNAKSEFENDGHRWEGDVATQIQICPWFVD